MSRSSNGIYFDTSSKSDVMGRGRNARHASYRAEVRIDGIRIRRRFKLHSEAERWIADMLERPVGTFNKKIDWSRDFNMPAEMCK